MVPCNYLIIITLIPIVTIQAEKECKKITSCSCECENGIIDLSPLDSKDAAKPRFYGIPNEKTPPDWYFAYNPCGPMIIGTTSCIEDITVCQYQPPAMHWTYKCGTQSSVKFVYEDNVLTMVSQATERTVPQPTIRTSKIQLKCDKSNEGKLEYHGEDTSTNTYKFTLTSKYACLPSGLSTGSVLCILLFVLLSSYIIAGILFNKYKRGATGAQMLPNISFWKSIPPLIRDGIRFALNRCKPIEVYREI